MPRQRLDPGEQDRLAVDEGGARVEDGVDRIRPVVRREDRVLGMAHGRAPARRVMQALRSRAARRRRTTRQTRRVEHELGAVEGERRLGALVCVQVLLAEAVAAAAGREVVERPVEPVAAEEPVERRAARGVPCSGSPVTANAASSASTNADASSGCSSPAAGRGLVAMAPQVAGQAQRAVGEPALVAEPAQRLEADRDVRRRGRGARRRRSARGTGGRCRTSARSSNQCHASDGVARCASASCSTKRSSSSCASGSSLSGSSRARPEHRVRRRAQRHARPRARRRVSRAASGGPDDRGHPRGGENLAERPDRAADVIADVRLVEPAPVVAHEVAHPAPSWSVACVQERRARGRGSGSRAGRRSGARARARPPRAARRRRRSSRVCRFGITPCACCDDADVVDEREQMVSCARS